MAENTLLQRLDGIEARFAEISTLITDPDVISDMKRYVKLTKEYKELEKLTKTTQRYRQLLNDIDEAKEILANESDADMRAMAREQLDSAQPHSKKRLNFYLSQPTLKTAKMQL